MKEARPEHHVQLVELACSLYFAFHRAHKCLFALQASAAVGSVHERPRWVSLDMSSEAVKLSDGAAVVKTPAAGRQFTPQQTFIRV